MKKINEEFVCVNCWKKISKAKKTCRNHCPFCFVSLHLDEHIPWDRKSDCLGKMYPVEYIYTPDITKILFVCSKCWKQHWNKSADDDNILLLPELIQKYRIYLS